MCFCPFSFHGPHTDACARAWLQSGGFRGKAGVRTGPAGRFGARWHWAQPRSSREGSSGVPAWCCPPQKTHKWLCHHRGPLPARPKAGSGSRRGSGGSSVPREEAGIPTTPFGLFSSFLADQKRFLPAPSIPKWVSLLIRDMRRPSGWGPSPLSRSKGQPRCLRAGWGQAEPHSGQREGPRAATSGEREVLERAAGPAPCHLWLRFLIQA